MYRIRFQRLVFLISAMADRGMLEEKWRIVFSLIDINKDGVVSSADVDFCKRTFRDMIDDADKKAAAVDDLDRYWNSLIFLGKAPDWSMEINGDKFVKSFGEAFTADKTGTQTLISKALGHLLAAADIDGTKVFTYEKFFKFHEAFNLAHDIVVRTTFNLIRPDAHDACTLDQVHEFYVELFVGENVERFNALKSAYKAVGML